MGISFNADSELRQSPFPSDNDRLRENPFQSDDSQPRSSERTASISERARNVVAWHMVVEEETNDDNLTYGTRIVGQFPPTDLTKNVGATIADAGAYGRENPIVQWVAGEAQTISFNAKLWSSNRDDQTARDKLAILELLTKPVSPMNRPPVVRFFWGEAIPGGMACLVQSIGGIQYLDVRSDGSVRGVDLQITLKRYVEFQIQRSVDTPMERTPKYVVRDGDTYEMIAYRRYGDPLLGVALRQMNPRFPMEPWAPADYAELQAGESIKLYDRSDIDSHGVKPASHIMNLKDPVTAITWRYYFKKRGSHIGVIPRR